ncbi:hypothetical protein IJE86_11740 [bacterium]|nr:hypothetical protein [bacterium]
MIFNYSKYKDIDCFVRNIPSNSNKSFTLIHKCNGIDCSTTPPTFTNKCFGCLFCVINNESLRSVFYDFWGSNIVESSANLAFKGEKVSLPSAKQQMQNPNKNLEFFTAKDETSNIQPWATGLLNTICSKENRISMEVPVFHPDYDRNGRLDICSITDEKLIIMESKTTLDDALSDERFVEQHTKYTEVINESTSDYIYITLIGGKESDLYPTNSPYCSGLIGGKTQRFYDLIINEKIKFISANALWLLSCKYLSLGSSYSWDTFLYDIFSEENTIGLLSAGKVSLINGQVEIVSL